VASARPAAGVGALLGAAALWFSYPGNRIEGFGGGVGLILGALGGGAALLAFRSFVFPSGRPGTARLRALGYLVLAAQCLLLAVALTRSVADTSVFMMIVPVGALLLLLYARIALWLAGPRPWWVGPLIALAALAIGLASVGLIVVVTLPVWAIVIGAHVVRGHEAPTGPS